VDQNYNNSQNDFLWTLLANPANDAQLYNYNLQRLVNDFPQSGILQALLAHSSDEKNLRRASAYFNAKSLYKLINAPASFIGVSDEKIILQNNIRYENFVSHQHENTVHTDSENYFSDHAVTETEVEEPVHTDEQPPVTGHEIAQALVDEHHTETDVSEIPQPIPVEGLLENNLSEEHLTEIHHPQVSNETRVEELVVNQPEEAHKDLIAEIESAASDILPHEHSIAHQAEETHEGLASEVESAASDILPHEHSIAHQAEETHEGLVPEIESAASDILPHEHSISHQAEETLDGLVSEIESVLPNATAHEHSAENIITEAHAEMAPVPESAIEQHVPVDNIVEEPVHEHKQQETITHVTEAHEPEAKITHHEENIEDETFDEIVGIENIDLEEDIVSNIAATDYFTFDRAFGEHKETAHINDAPESPAQQVTNTASQEESAPINENDTEQQDVSKYHDEKMPYTFMWWLDKTRKEHAGVYQPYVASETTETPKTRIKSVADELQQQYYENIFHITSVEELDKSVPPPPFAPNAFEPKRKEQVIIERFIQEEPQIRPQSSDKLDNENKAKKSSEDRDELVTETLAAIYSDQMLYHKAIASYKKLMLKFPEKSRYFAEKIEQLEKKTN